MRGNLIRTYSELIKLPTFQERFDYLKLGGTVGEDTFGFRRYLNQKFYMSPQWKRLRDEIIVRDNGCELALPDMPIMGKVYIHHLNPMTIDDVQYLSPLLTDPENLVCVSYEMHNAIHYGDISKVDHGMAVRTPNDMCPWRSRND